MYVFVIVELLGAMISATLSSAAGFCVALQKGVASPRLYTSPSKMDSQPVCLLISLCEIQ